VTTHVSCRLPRDLGERVDETATVEGTVRSEIVRRAIRQFLEDEPNGVSSTPANSGEKRTGHGTDNDRTSDAKNSIYDPSQDLRSNQPD